MSLPPMNCPRCGLVTNLDGDVERGLCTACHLVEQLGLNAEDSAALLDPRDTSYLMGAPLYFDRQGAPVSAARWSELTCDDAYRRVAGDHVGDSAWVSTIWLGTDHRFDFGRSGLPPIIFETMVFGLNSDERPCMRYCTEAEALEGHHRTVADLRARRSLWFSRGDDWDVAQEPCPICGDAWHGLDHPLSGCPGEFASDVEIKEWKRSRL